MPVGAYTMVYRPAAQTSVAESEEMELSDWVMPGLAGFGSGSGIRVQVLPFQCWMSPVACEVHAAITDAQARGSRMPDSRIPAGTPDAGHAGDGEAASHAGSRHARQRLRSGARWRWRASGSWSAHPASPRDRRPSPPRPG